MQSHRLPSNYFNHFKRVGQQAFGSGSFSIAEVESANDLQAWKILQGSSTGRLCGAVPFEFQHRHSLTALSIPGVSPSAEFSRGSGSVFPALSLQ